MAKDPVIASLVLIVRRGRLYLAPKKGRPRVGKGLLNAPGGMFERDRDSSFHACAIRETYEESGVRLIPSRLERCAQLVVYAAGELDFVVHVYRTDVFVGNPRETESMGPPEWHQFSRIPYQRMHAADQYWMPRALAGEKFRANIQYAMPGVMFIPPIDFSELPEL